MRFQLPLSGSRFFLSWRLAEANFRPFQLPLSGSRTGIGNVIEEHLRELFQLPLSGSPQSRARAVSPRESSSFNSLSRDHRKEEADQEPHDTADFQLPLSGSLMGFVFKVMGFVGLSFQLPLSGSLVACVQRLQYRPSYGSVAWD